MSFNFLKNKISLEPEKPISAWLYSWRPLAIFALVAFIVFGQTIFFDFVYLDDNALILDNAPILAQANLADIFANDVFFSANKFYYRPLMSLSLWLDFKVIGPLPFWYHLNNIALVALVAYLLFLFLQSFKFKRPLAFWVALIFLIHPALTSVASWIPARNDSLLAIFLLASWLFFKSFLRGASWGSWLGTSIFFLAALFTKESAIFLPFLMLLYLYLFRQENKLAPDLGVRLGALAGSWLAAIFTFFILRMVALEGSGSRIIDLIWSVLKNLPAIFLFLGKALFPFNLSVFPILADSSYLPGLGVLIIIVSVFLLSRSKLRPAHIFFGSAWFLVFLLPSFLRPNPNITADFLEHRLYVPLIGLVLVILELPFIKEADWGKKKNKLALACLILLFLLLTINYQASYRNRLSFWSSASLSAPHSAFAASNLGAMYYLDGDLNKAEKSYLRALKINPKERMTHNNLGLIYVERGDYLSAEREFKQELAFNPNYDKVLFNLGKLYQLQKRYPEAAAYFQAALSVNPRHIEAYRNLLLLLDKLE